MTVKTAENTIRRVLGVSFQLKGGILITEDGWSLTQCEPQSWLLMAPPTFVGSIATAARHIAKARDGAMSSGRKVPR